MLSLTSVRRKTLVLLTALAVGLVGSDLSMAAKPGGGGTVPPGTIYFEQTDNGFWSMLADGSDKAPSFGSEPSYLLHGGQRWFLQSQSVGFDLDGTLHAELFAVSADGLTAVQLTNDPFVEPLDAGTRAWAKDDSFFSYVALIYTPEGTQAALFVANLDWSLGDPLAAAPLQVLDAGFDVDVGADITVHDWSPTGDEVVYELASVSVVKATKFFGDGTTQTRNLGTGRSPNWSPDGARIAFLKFGEIWTVLPDGTGAVRITSATSDRWQSSLGWSPDSKHLAFTQVTRKQKGFQPATYAYDVLRVSASGGATTNLTGDIATNSGLVGWR
jgi:Tol biopolymer transport system component